MIYITGDMHGIDGFERFGFTDTLDTATKDDYLIVCGDFGCIWYGDQRDDLLLDALEAKPFSTLFVDGNHENFERLSRYPREYWHGGQVHRIRPSVLHLMRGEVFDIEGKRFFTMGGACSVDKALRVSHISWWREEVPSYAECQHALAALDSVGWRVDYVITHAAPTSVLRLLNLCFTSDTVTDFLETLNEKLEFHHWYFGHYHMVADIGEKYSCLYEPIIALDNGRKRTDE